MAELWEQQEGENDLNYGRFRTFLFLGPDRNLPETAKTLKISMNYIKVLYREHDWKARAEAYDVHLTALALKKIDTSAASDAWAKRYEEGRVVLYEQQMRMGLRMANLVMTLSDTMRDDSTSGLVGRITALSDQAVKLLEGAAGYRSQIPLIDNRTVINNVVGNNTTETNNDNRTVELPNADIITKLETIGRIFNPGTGPFLKSGVTSVPDDSEDF